MLNILALIGVLLSGLYFVGLAIVAFAFPENAARFLLGFAKSSFAHYLEMVLRLAVGFAFLIRAPLMVFQEAFSLFAWILILTTTCLLAIPWRWHQRFAQRVVPYVVRRPKLVAVASLALGALVLTSAIYPLG